MQAEYIVDELSKSSHVFYYEIARKSLVIESYMLLNNLLVLNKCLCLSFMSGKLKESLLSNFEVIVIYYGPKIDLECQKAFRAFENLILFTAFSFINLSHRIFSHLIVSFNMG